MTERPTDHLGTIATIDGVQMPRVRYWWKPLTYRNLLGAREIVQANRYFGSVHDALKMLRFTMKMQERGSQGLYKDQEIARRMPYLYYRGQSRVEFELMPSLYRNLPVEDDDREPEIVDRIAKSVIFNQRAEAALPEYRSLTHEQKRATARHYGLPSDYVDLTRDPHVAAYFATRDFTDGLIMGPDPGADGVIYMINLLHLSDIFRTSWHNDENGVVLSFGVPAARFKLPYLTINARNEVEQAELPLGGKPDGPPLFTFRWTQPHGIRRIDKQSAVFQRFGPGTTALYDDATLSWRQATSAWQIMDFLAFKFIFRQRSAYNDFWRGIRSGRLISTSDPLQAIADDILMPGSLR